MILPDIVDNLVNDTLQTSLPHFGPELALCVTIVLMLVVRILPVIRLIPFVRIRLGRFGRRLSDGLAHGRHGLME